MPSIVCSVGIKLRTKIEYKRRELAALVLIMYVS
jgi:hypothetical protein